MGHIHSFQIPRQMLRKYQYTRQSWSLLSQKLQCGGKYKIEIKSHRKAEEGIPDRGNHASKTEEIMRARLGRGKRQYAETRRSTKGCSAWTNSGELGKRKIRLEGYSCSATEVFSSFLSKCVN